MPDVVLTKKEMTLLRALGKHLKPENIDWSAVATDASFSTGKRARDKWNLLRIRLCAGKNAKDTDKSKGSGTPAGGSKTGTKKRQNDMANGEDDDEERSGRETKKSRKTDTKGRKGKANVGLVDDSDDANHDGDASAPELKEESDPFPISYEFEYL